MLETYTCCFIGHRQIEETEQLKTRLRETVEHLIVQHGVYTFLFGSKSRFNSLCLELVTELKEKHPHIQRVYVRAEFPVIDETYEQYLLEFYEQTYFPPKITGAGRAVYVQRNREMIDNSQFCVVYYDKVHLPTTRTSGTKLALDYAIKQEKQIIQFP